MININIHNSGYHTLKRLITDKNKGVPYLLEIIDIKYKISNNKKH